MWTCSCPKGHHSLSGNQVKYVLSSRLTNNEKGASHQQTQGNKSRGVYWMAFSFQQHQKGVSQRYLFCQFYPFRAGGAVGSHRPVVGYSVAERLEEPSGLCVETQMDDRYLCSKWAILSRVAPDKPVAL
ncbi:hypothetical protein MLD38_038719 [Melastoma candidum]|uniref:Uncharacterized protein n=1 Tax=Melastoma candidum TaxID=119954 RepID=A0ACB9L0J1_9MYRT|nr:hypothetical protein MLD38_038719 [Melastoma candidum]